MHAAYPAMKHCLVLLIFLLSYARYGCSTANPFRVKKSSIRIVDGDENCITNCSRKSSQNNVFMRCEVDDCKPFERSQQTSQASEVDKTDDVWLEKYNNGQRDKLALYIRWSPVDNVSLKWTNGYLINITDGLTSYSKCYYFNTPMEFQNNAHDTYYNDCFGKWPGTLVRPGSTINVRIIALPLYESDPEDGAKIGTVEVPDCADERLHSLPECKVPGGRPVTRPCMSETCNSTVEANGKTHHIACTVSDHEFLTPSKCHKVARTTTGTVSKPMHIPQEQDWYKFLDKRTKEVRVALNFTWSPSPDSSIKHLKHYFLTVTPMSKVSVGGFTVCYAIHTGLTQQKHQDALFYYDCYGRSDYSKFYNVTPGERYRVHVESRPNNVPVRIGPNRVMEGQAEFDIDIPGCNDKRMSDVSSCQNKYWDKAKLEILEIFCHNTTVKVRYELPLERDHTVKIFICETGLGLQYCGHMLQRHEELKVDSPRDDPCQCHKSLYQSQDLYGAKGILYSQLPSSVDPKANLSLFIHPTGNGDRRAVKYFNLSQCEAHEAAWLMILVVIACVLCVIALLSLVCYFRQDTCALKRFIPASFLRPSTTTIRAPSGDMNDIITPSHEVEYRPEPVPPVMPMPDNIRVFVVFMDDHELHTNVVHYFCAFLKSDLGLDVRWNVWEQEKAAMNKTMYMKTNLERADKVIIICSAGTEKCLDRPYNGDMISPVIRDVCNLTFIGKNPGKFLVGYFPYSSQQHVPEMLRDQCMMYFSLFKLMKQFEQFYFRVVGVEQFQEGGIQRIEKIAFDRYYDPSLTSCGQKLKQGIEKMVAFNDANPTWPMDRYGSDMPVANIPPAPEHVYEDMPVVTSEKYGDGHPSIMHMQPKPPPEIPAQNYNRPAQETTYRPRPTKKQPTKRAANEYQKLSSYASTEDSSFMLTDSENLSPSTPDDVSCGPRYATPGRRRVPLQRESSAENAAASQSSYHAGCFEDEDFGDSESSSLRSGLIESNVTQVTRLGLTESQERIAMPEATNLLVEDIPVFEDHIEHCVPSDDDVVAPKGLVTLESIDDDIAKIEETFMSINSDTYRNSRP